MNRRDFMKLSGIATGTVLLGNKSFAKRMIANNIRSGENPNILYIMTDQQSYNMMSCMGNKWLSTPNMDYIAKKGYRFEKAYCANPVCMPSRFSLLTGHYASDVGVKENTVAYNDDKVSEIVKTDALGKIFRKAGYKTLYSGKTHLYGTKDVSEYGFELDGRDPYEGPAIYAEKIIPELAKDKNKPFFLFLSFVNPHDICYKAGMDKRFNDKLSEDQVRETNRILAIKKSMSEEEYRKQIPPRVTNLAAINGEEPEMVIMANQARDWDDDQWNLYNWMYHRLTESVDALIGRALTALKKAGLEENTIIVFTADHGDMHGAHKLILKNAMFEECQRIPFIFVGNGIKSNYADNSTLTCNGLDFIPTICDLAGIQAPQGLPGTSLKPLLTGTSSKLDREYIITENYNASQIHDGRYKYTLYELPGYPETLTDLESNPGETINYADNPAYAKIKTDLKKKLLADLQRRGLTPIRQDRTIRTLRKAEKAIKEEKKAERKEKGGKKSKGQDDNED